MLKLPSNTVTKATPKVNKNNVSASLTCVKERSRFKCSNCSLGFSSKYLLDCHIQAKCDKKACTKTPNRRLSFKVKRSFVHSPVRTSGRKLMSKTPRVSTSIKAASPLLKITCDVCSESFTCDQQFLRHKVIQHGMQTPDKTLKNTNNNKDVKIRTRAHSGVPASRALKNAFANIRLKLAE